MAPNRSRKNDEELEERESLLPALPAASSSTSSQHPLEASPSSTAPSLVAIPVPTKTNNIQSSPSLEVSLCRICLEEDTPANLISPCACRGTQQFAHHACIQRWISEKGPNALRCEVCHQNYTGSFVVPPPQPPRPPQAPAGVTMFLIQDPVTGQLQVATTGPRGTMVLPPHAQFLDEERERSEAQAMHDALRGQRSPALSCLFSAVIFMLLIVMMHNTAPDGSEEGGGNFDYPSMPHFPPAPPIAPMTPAQDVLAIVLFVITKMIFIGIPIWIIIRIAQKQAERERAHSARNPASNVYAAPRPFAPVAVGANAV